VAEKWLGSVTHRSEIIAEEINPEWKGAKGGMKLKGILQPLDGDV
jgi:hypothetical protein